MPDEATVWPVQKSLDEPLKRLGRFELISPIGSGGMATIYLSRIAGPAGFEKPVALKVIHAHLAEDPEFIQMFLDEARLAAQLQHPNIVQIFELGEDAGVYFIAMEYLRGETLASVIRRVFGEEGRTMDPRLACHVLQQACEGLHYAHELTNINDEPLGLVHRDISPQNLFLTYSGSVKLMDFGIARAEGSSHSTRPGSLKGKFSYMSPEQASGQSFDHRADVFSLGVVFWEMITGRRLFKGRNDMESLRLVNQCQVPPPGGFRHGIPPALDRVIAQALAKDPTERYQTALELHHDIGLVMDQLGSPLNTHELAQRMRRWFAKEAALKRKLLNRTLENAASVTPTESLPPTVLIEETPSPSEPSGVRVRDVDIVQISPDETTPYDSGDWEVSPPTEPEMEQPTIVDPAAASSQPSPPPSSDPADPAEKDELVENQGASPESGSIRVWIVLSVIAGLLGVLALASVFTFPYLDREFFREPPPARPDIDPRLISSDPLVVDPPAAEPPPRDEEPGPAGSGDLTPSIEVSGDLPPEPGGARAGTEAMSGDTTTPGADPEPAGGPDTVVLSLTVRPQRAQVSVDGEVQEDPSSIRLPRSTEPVLVRVYASGYHRLSFRVTPEQDIERQVVLRRRRGSSADQGQPGRSEDLVSNPYRPR